MILSSEMDDGEGSVGECGTGVDGEEAEETDEESGGGAGELGTTATAEGGSLMREVRGEDEAVVAMDTK